MHLFIYTSVLLAIFMIIKGDFILDKPELIIFGTLNKNLTNLKLDPSIESNTEVKQNDDKKKDNTKDRIMFGRAVFLPFFNRPFRPRPRIASIMRRTGIAEYHPHHKYCFYRIYRYKKR